MRATAPVLPGAAMPDRRGRRWAAAWSSALPGKLMLAVVALALSRAVTMSLELAQDGRPPLLDIVYGFVHVMLMAVPIVAIVAAAQHLAPADGALRWAALAGAAAAAPGVGVGLRLLTRDVLGRGPDWSMAASLAAQVWPRYAILAGALAVGLEAARRQREALAAARRAEIDRESLERDHAEMRLAVLRAQVEPHFLFNTLATVRRLGDTDPQRAGAMLDSLARYLQVALPDLRGTHTSLGQECELVRAYLELQQVRMGDRLAYVIDVPAALRALQVPPLMVLTLVENAIKHGLQPSIRGGLVRFGAALDGETLVLTVADTGVGMAGGSGSGTGLANIRDRLAAEHGDEAGLSIDLNDLGGVTATLRLPHR